MLLIIFLSLILMLISVCVFAGSKELLKSFEGKGEYPFSFNYGGISSDEFLSDWEFASEAQKSDETTDSKIFTYTDPETKLTITANVNYYTDSDVIDWTLYFTNTGDKDSKIISHLNSLKIEVPLKTSDDRYKSKKTKAVFEPETRDVVLYKTAGSKGHLGLNMDEYNISAEYLQKDNPIKLQNRNMFPCYDYYSPYWTLAWPGGGMVAAVGWTGNWTSNFYRETNSVKISAGIREDKLYTYLKPNESIRSPRMMLTMYEGEDIQIGLNSWRNAMINHITPKKDGQPAFIPIAYSTSGKEMHSTTEDIDRSYIESYKDMNFEMTWFDAWFQRDGYPACRGNYHLPISDISDPIRYPHGIEPLVDMVRASNMEVLVWFAPEYVMPNTFIAKEHPEYVMLADGSEEGCYALVNPDAREYMINILDTAIKEWHLSIFRTDSAVEEPQLISYVGEHSPDRVGIAENQFVVALYMFWDELVKRNPGLLIDNCCGGGNRMDLELMSRSITMWRSDENVIVQQDKNKSAILNQFITFNLNNYIPWTTGGCHGPEAYYVRSGYNTGLTFVGDTREPDFDKAEMMKGIEECKRLRKYALGNFYPIHNCGTTEKSWCAWQYHRPAEDDGYLVAFRREEAPETKLVCYMKGVNPDKKYKVKIYDTYDLKKQYILSGKELMEFKATVKKQPGSVLVEYSAL